MILRSSVSALAVVAVCAAITLAVGAPASAATTPGTGAVIFNADGTPIGSELTYGADATPQYVYTSKSYDDDAMGLADGIPAHTQSQDQADMLRPTAGIPIGFGVTIGGTTFDQLSVSSNGIVCFIAPANVDTALDQCAGSYFSGISTIGSAAATDSPTADFATLLPFSADLAPYADETVDANDDGVPESCTFGSFLYNNAGAYYCSSISWGQTTYEGKAAFAATWYHDPSIGESDQTMFNTFQVVIVNNGGGNVGVVYNYDDTNNGGETTKELTGDSDVQAAACADFASDPTTYSTVGFVSYSAATTAVSQLDFYGPACTGGLTPTPSADLMTGGASQLSTHSLNSAVAGRYAYAIVGGVATLTLPAAVVVTPALAATGIDLTFPILISLLLLAAGIAIVITRRTRFVTV